MEKLQTMLKNIQGYKIHNDRNGLDYKLTKGFAISTYRDDMYICGIRFGTKGYWVLLNYLINNQMHKFNEYELTQIFECFKFYLERDMSEFIRLV